MEYLEHIKTIVEALGHISVGLILVATTVSRLVNRGKAHPLVKDWADRVLDIIDYLPTVGINPRTKALKEKNGSK